MIAADLIYRLHERASNPHFHGALLAEAARALEERGAELERASNGHRSLQGAYDTLADRFRAAESERDALRAALKDLPDDKGVWIWLAMDDFSQGYAAVHVHKRPTKACNEGGPLKGSALEKMDFYDGCRVEDWGRGKWMRVDALRAHVLAAERTGSKNDG